MGADEYHPLSRRGSNFSTQGSIGYMVIDAIDTMYLMGLDEEYNESGHGWRYNTHLIEMKIIIPLR